MSGAPPSSPNICYYSPRSPYSVAFLEELARSPYSREFRFVCVDANDAGIRPVLPPYVKAVPTLMIAGEAEPRVDSQVMNWLSERRLSERRTVPVSTPGGMRSGGAAASGGGSSAAAAVDVGPMAFGGSDMMFGGGDEGFAYLDDNTNPSSENMVRMAGNMASLNDLHMLSAPDSRTMPGAMLVAGGSASGSSSGGSGGSGSGAATTAKAKALQSAFESFRSSRDKDIPGPVARR